MSFWQRFKNWLFGPLRRRGGPTDPFLYPLDVDQLTQELRLVEEAKQLGEAKLPASDATTICGPEARVVQRMERARRDYIDWTSIRLAVLNSDLARCDVTRDVNRALQAASEFERKASAILADNESLVRTLGESASAQQAEIDHFRREHGLSREARYPTSTGRFLAYSLLVLVVILEGFANAYFFSQGIDTGLIGGFAYAAVLAFLNVGIAFAFGKFLVGYVFHMSVIGRLTGAASCLLAFASMLMMGLVIAHFRDSLTAEMADPARAAWESILANPFELRDVLSYSLLLVSLVFGLLALFDGLLSDDQYPGYGKLSRRTSDAWDEYNEELDLLRLNLEDLKNADLKVLGESVKTAQAAVVRFESLIQDKKNASSRLDTALRNAENCLNALLRVFRSHNELHRGDAARPVYFDSVPRLQQLRLPEFNITSDEMALSRQRALVSTLLAETEALRGSIQASFNLQFDRLKPLGVHFTRQDAS